MFGSVAQDGNGWTQNTLGSGKKYIYVSAAGSDSNNGLTTGTPKLTIAAGIAAMSGGDGLLLRRGDTFANQSLGASLPAGTTTDPTFIGTYGAGARPRVQPDSSTSVYDGTANNIVIQSICFKPNSRTLTTGELGLALYPTSGNYVIVEDCVIDQFKGNGLIVAGGTGSQVRRNIIMNTYGPSAQFQGGLYCESILNFILEENVFYNNGADYNGGEPTVFNHNVYFDALMSGTSKVWGNLFFRAPSSSLKILQQNGTLSVLDNVFAQNGFGAEIGAYGGQGEYPLDGFTVPDVQRNVVVEGNEDLGANNGWGLMFRRCHGGTAKDNIIANRVPTSTSIAFYLEKVTWGPGNIGITLEDNVVYNWRGITLVQAGGNSGLAFVDNIFEEPNLTQSSDPPNILYLEASNIATFTGDKFQRGGNTIDWFDAPGVTTFAQFDAASYTTGVSSGSTTFADSTRTATTWLTSVKSQANFAAGTVAVFCDPDDVQDTQRITDIAAMHAWIGAGYNKDFGDVPPPEPAYTQASYQIFAGSGALPQPGSTTAASNSANAIQSSTTATTSSTTTIPAGATTGKPVYVFATSRDHTAGTTRMAISNTASDTWTLVSESTDRKAAVWWTRAGASTASSTLTVSGAVGSIAVGCTVIDNTVASGDPHTNVSVEDNASGNETHAGFTPSQDRSLICMAVFNTGNDNTVTSPSTTNPGALTERLQRLNTGGNDCAVYLASAPQAGAATATGNLTWAQTNGTTKSIAFAIKPLVVAASGRASLASQDVPVAFTSGTDYGVQARIRNSGDAAGNDEFKWQYNHVDDDNTWHDLTTTTSNPVYIVSTSDFANGADVPEFIGGTGTYVTDNNAALDTTGQLVTTAALAASGALESHVNVRMKSGLTVDDTIQMRLVEGDGTVFTTYTNLPTIIVGPDSTPPTLSLATIAGNGTTLVLDFDKAIVGTEHLGWTISASGGAVTTVSGTGSGTAQFAVNLSRTILASETVTISYSTSTGDLASSGNDLANITNASVTNESTQTPPDPPPVSGDKLLIGVGSGYLQLEVEGQGSFILRRPWRQLTPIHYGIAS